MPADYVIKTGDMIRITIFPPVIGAFLPWILVPDLFGLVGPAYESIEVGWEGDGIVTGWIGVILLVGALLSRGRAGRRYSVPGAILAAITVSVVLLDFQRILEIGPSTGFFAATDIGLYATLLGGLLAIIGSLRKTALDTVFQNSAAASS
jgi:hypothetical protein